MVDTWWYEHMSWCQGTHNDVGECVIQACVSDDYETYLRLVGAPGDNQYVELDGALYQPEHLDTAIRLLAQLRDALAAQADVETHLDWTAYDAANDDDARDGDADG